MNDLVVMIDCPKCGQHKPADTRDTHLCVDCAKAENSRYTYMRMHQDNWMEVAADSGLDLWVQQPGETQWEFTVWTTYRDSYPGRKPSYSDVAQQLDTTYNVVKKIAQRWTFPARMQAWIAECDRVTLTQRYNEILDMNKAHISMAQRLRDKLSVAIDCVVPETLEPKDIVALAKLSTELERKARVDTMSQDDSRVALLKESENPELKKSPTKQGDLSEVVQILLQSGALGKVSAVGVRETTTREVVLKDDV